VTETTWWRRNRWFLVALAVIVPAAVLVALSDGWFSYAEMEQGRATVVASGESGDYAGATWSVTDAGAIAADTDAGESIGLLPGTSLVVVTLEVEPGDEPPSCTLELEDAVGTRLWDPATYDVDVSADDDAETYCPTDAEGPYTLQTWFVVPDDAVKDSRLRLSTLDGLPELLLFEL
jgi:hypothetical protein